MTKVTYNEDVHAERLLRSFREVDLIIKLARRLYNSDLRNHEISFLDYIKLVNDNVTRESIALSVDAK